MHRTADTTRSEVGCTRGGQPHELVQSSSENDTRVKVEVVDGTQVFVWLED
ncbi:hypothetical protein ACRCPX_17730 [Pseudomonas aeruginosa]